MANRRKTLIPGFSLERALGITMFRKKLSRITGIPTTKKGLTAKLVRKALRWFGIR